MAPSSSALTIYAFGVTAFVAGCFALLSPSDALTDECKPVAAGNGLAAIAMGIYYCLAASQENVLFFKLTVPMRLLTTVVFWGHGWTAVAAWEGMGALLTAFTLLF